jgi:hypothetical protein
MPKRAPEPLSPGERRARGRRVARVARGLGFAGRAEYRHVYSQTGGAQYAQGSTTEEDLLIVFAEAFVRDRDPDDFPSKRSLHMSEVISLWCAIRESRS